MPSVTTPFRARPIGRAAATLLAGTAVLLAATPGSALAQAACPGAGAAPSVRTLHRAAGAVVCLVNAERARHGLRALRGNSQLRRAAGLHSRDMVRRGFFSHLTPNGTGLGDRLRRSGYLHGSHTWHAGEALGHGSGTASTPDVIVADWIASPGHHRILLERDIREVGVGVAAGAPQPTAGAATYTLDTGGISR